VDVEVSCTSKYVRDREFQLILDLKRCRDRYSSDDECILDRDEIAKLYSF